MSFDPIGFIFPKNSGGSGGGTNVKISEGGAGYSEVKVTEIVPEQVIKYASSSMGYPIDFTPIVGEEYTVVVNGTEYKVTAQEYSDIVYLGDMSSMLPPLVGNGEPWGIVSGQGMNIFAWADGTKSDTTLSITGTAETIYPIDKKFLPSGVLPVVDFTTSLPATDDNSNLLTEEEQAKLKEGAINRMPIVVRFDFGGGNGLSAVALYFNGRFMVDDCIYNTNIIFYCDDANGKWFVKVESKS